MDLDNLTKTEQDKLSKRIIKALGAKLSQSPFAGKHEVLMKNDMYFMGQLLSYEVETLLQFLTSHANFWLSNIITQMDLPNPFYNKSVEEINIILDLMGA